MSSTLTVDVTVNVRTSSVSLFGMPLTRLKVDNVSCSFTITTCLQSMADGGVKVSIPLPPPPYSPTVSQGSNQQRYSGSASASASSSPSMFTPPVVPNPHHSSAYRFGPTPPQQLQLPYAYYDPHSAHSVAMADSRARTRFTRAIIYAFGVLLLASGVVSWWGEDWSP